MVGAEILEDLVTGGEMLMEGEVVVSEVVGSDLFSSDEYRCELLACDKVGLRMVDVDAEGEECQGRQLGRNLQIVGILSFISSFWYARRC